MSEKQSGFNQNGFTLVELAIVLMIVGLLIAGVLKGKELIENARITSDIRAIGAIDAAVVSFRDAFGTLPGDMIAPATHIDNCTNLPCNFNGNSNGQIDSTNGEALAFWSQLGKSGRLSKVSADATDPADLLPTLATGGYFTVGYLTAAPVLQSGNYLQPFGSPTNGAGTFTALEGVRIDRKMDDGLPATGSIVAVDGFDSNHVAHTCIDATTSTYDETNEASLCTMDFLISN